MPLTKNEERWEELEAGNDWAAGSSNFYDGEKDWFRSKRNRTFLVAN